MNRQPKSLFSPILSAEHGATISLVVCFLIGVMIAGEWNSQTTLAAMTAFGAFQVQGPLAYLVRRRKIDARRFLWGAIYGIMGGLGAALLLFTIPDLDRIYIVAAATLAINLVWVYLKDQKSVLNELAIFAALSLALPFAYTATKGVMLQELLGYWLLATAVLSSSIFTVRLRLIGDKALSAVAAYHIIAMSMVFMLVRAELLRPEFAYTFLIPIAKVLVILFQMDKYRALKLTTIGFMETGLSLIFMGWVWMVL